MKILETYSPRIPIDAIESPPSIQTDTIKDGHPDIRSPIRRRTIRYSAPQNESRQIAMPSRNTSVSGFSLNEVMPSNPIRTRLISEYEVPPRDPLATGAPTCL